MRRGRVAPAPPNNTIVSNSSPPIKRQKTRRNSVLSSPPTWYPIKILDTISAVLALLSLSLAYYENSAFYDVVESSTPDSNPRDYDNAADSAEQLRAVNTVLTLVLLGTVTGRWGMYQRLMKAERKIGRMVSGKTLSQLALELTLCSVHCPPGLNSSFEGAMLDGSYSYSWDSVLFTIMLARVYLCLRLFLHYSKWTEERYMGRKLRVSVDVSWVVRAEFKERPYRTVAGFTLLAVCVFAVALRVYERSFTGNTKCATDLQYQSNSMWALIITMTTVGYGDAFPSTHLGRLVATVCCLLGMLLTSLMVLSLTINSSLSTQEMKAYLKIKRVRTRESIKGKAADVIKCILRLCRVQKKGKGGALHQLSQSFLWFVKLKRCIRLFSDCHRRDTADDPPVEDLLHALSRRFKRDLKELKGMSYACRTLRSRCDFLVERFQSSHVQLLETSATQDRSSRLVLALHNAVASGRLHLITRTGSNL